MHKLMFFSFCTFESIRWWLGVSFFRIVANFQKWHMCRVEHIRLGLGGMSVVDIMVDPDFLWRMKRNERYHCVRNRDCLR